jgi:hypothetical protein
MLINKAVEIIGNARLKLGDMSHELAVMHNDGLRYTDEAIEFQNRIMWTYVLLKILDPIIQYDDDGLVESIYADADHVTLNRLILLLQKASKAGVAPVSSLILNPVRRTLGDTPGPPGDEGEAGAPGADLSAQNFRVLDAETGTVELDRFDAESGVSCEWKWNIRTATNTQIRRHGMEAIWVPGSTDTDDLKFAYNGGPDVIGDDPDESVTITARLDTDENEIVLEAVITAGTWTIEGERRFTPTEGGYSDPTMETLAEGNIPIGQADNTPSGKPVSGAITIDKDGVTTLQEDVVSNENIADNAGIEFAKMEALTANSGLGTDNDGKVAVVTGSVTSIIWTILTAGRVLITDPITGLVAISGITTTILNYLATLTGNVQDQLNDKLSKLGGTMTGALISIVTGEFRGGIRTASSGVYYKKHKFALPTWNMDSVALIAVDLTGVTTFDKVTSISVMIHSDNGDDFPLTTGRDTDLIEGNAWASGDVAYAPTANGIVLYRRSGGFFDDTLFNSTSFSRGRLYIEYEA